MDANEQLAGEQEVPWQAPQIADRSLFLRQHPQCVVDAALLENLGHYIEAQAHQLNRTCEEDLYEDIYAEIIAGIIECATYFRVLDDQGQPIFDYLAQKPSYIVRHAAGKISSQIRRDRQRSKLTVSLDSPVILDSEDEEEEEGLLAVVSDPDAHADSGHLELLEIAREIDTQLADDEGARQVWGLMMTGHDRREIGALLGLPRQRVHDRCLRIREAYAAIDPRGARLAISTRGRRSSEHLMFKPQKTVQGKAVFSHLHLNVTDAQEVTVKAVIK